MRLWPFGRKKRRRGRSDEPWLSPETKQAITGVLLILVGIVAAFSLFGQAGRVGQGLLALLRRIFGYLAWLSPLLFLYVGYRLVRPNAEPLPRWRVVGAVLLVVGLLGGFHSIGVAPDDALQVAAEGKGGGYFGFAVSYPISLALSPLIGQLIFVAAVLIGIFMAFDLSPATIWECLRARRERGAADEDEEAEEDEEGEEPAEAAVPRFRIRGVGGAAKPDPAQLQLDEERQQKEQEQQDLRRKQLKAANKKYTPPPLELLASSSRQPEGGDIEANKDIIKSTLDNFNIAVAMGKAKVGPTVTQYTFRPDEGIRLSQITALQNDLARALKAHPVRIEAPIPNTDLVGIEIPNKEVALVRLRDLLASKEIKRSESPLTFALGRDVSGGAVASEIDRMPHLLIAGATNSGKSVSIHSILMSLLYRNSPSLLRLILIDPKRVELTAYNGIPHLWGEPVIVDTNKALNALKWVLREMDRRYKLLEESGSRNLFSYNVNNPNETLPFIVIVVDELADLMAKHAREVEGPIVRLALLARAVGIHLVLATQRPSVNVITGLIKANVPARIAFKVASQVDSRTIIDMGGAEKLVGTGDMLYMSSDNTKPRRLQGGFVSEDEVREVVKFIVEHNETEEPSEDDSITVAEGVGSGGGGFESGDDPLFEEAKRVALASGKISASLLQRRLRVGYARAARLLDMLEEAGVIGPAEGNKPREVIAAESAQAAAAESDGGTEAEPAEEDYVEDQDSTADESEYTDEDAFEDEETAPDQDRW